MYINIMGTTYSIRQTEDLHASAGDLDGMIDYNKSEIHISTDAQSEDRKHEILMHEIVHGISSHQNLHLEEDTVQRIAVALHQMGVSEFLWREAEYGQTSAKALKSPTEEGG